MKEYTHVTHPFDSIFDRSSEILILGSFPSVKSREVNFYYGHKNNRFWKVMEELYHWEELDSIEKKKDFLLQKHIAIWDVIESCDIVGSSDSSIKNVVPADLSLVINNSRIERIYCNGKTAGRLFMKYQQADIACTVLPSTSSANAAYSLEDLIREWSVLLDEKRLNIQ